MTGEKLQCPNCRSNNITIRGKRTLVKGLSMMTGILTILLLFLGVFVAPALTNVALFVWLGGLLLIGLILLVVPAERIEMLSCQTCDFRWLRRQFDGSGN